MRKRVPLLLAGIFLVQIGVAGGLEAAPETSPAPVAAYISTASPATLVDTIDALAEAILKNTPKDGSLPPNVTRTIVSSINLPSLFDNPDLRLSALVALDSGEPEFALVMDGINPKRLAADLKKRGFELSVEGENLIATATPFDPDMVFHLAPLGDTRILASVNPEWNRKFSSVARKWRPEHPEGTDIRLLVNVQRLEEIFPDQFAEYRELAGEDISWAIAADLPRTIPENIRQAFGKGLAAVIGRVAPLPLEIGQFELTLTVDADILDLVCSVRPKKGGVLAALSASYADSAAPAFKLAGAIGKDAYLYSAYPRTGGTLLGEGDLLGAAAGIFTSAFVPAQADAIVRLNRAYGQNAVTEEICGYYARDGGMMRVGFARVADGREYAGLLARSIEVADAVMDVALSDAKSTVKLNIESGKAGPANYRRAYASHTGSKSPESDAIERYSLYLASNKDTVLTVFGPDIAPETVPDQIARLARQAPNALVDEPEVADVLRRVSECRLGHTLFKPMTFFRALLALSLQSGNVKKIFPADDPDKALSLMPDSGKFVAYGFDAAPDALGLTIAIPLQALNDFIVASIMWSTFDSVERGPVESGRLDD